MPCPSCRAELPAQARFCDHCGTAVQNAAELGSPAPATGDGGPSPPLPRRRRGRLVTALVLPALVVGAGVAGALAARRLFSPSGAESPQAAVEALFAAVDDQDPLAALQVLAPHEAEPLQAVVRGFLDEAADAGVVADPSDPLLGFEFTVEDLDLDVEELHADVAKVVVTDGSISYEADPDLLEDGLSDAVEDESGEVDVGDLEDERSGEDIYLMAVREGGAWYVSPLYTLAEYLREEEDGADADFDASRSDAPAGAATAQDAVGDLLDSALSLDSEEVRDALPPDEFGVAYDYERFLLDGVVLAGAEDASVDIEDLELSEADAGDGAVAVTVERMSASVEVGADRTSLLVEDGCLEIDGEEERCGLFDRRDSEFTVVVREVGGGWFVSPLATVAAQGELLGRMLAEQLDAALDDEVSMAAPEPQPEPEPEPEVEQTPLRAATGAPDAAGDAGGVLAPGSRVSGYLASGGSDTWAFRGDRGDSVTLATDAGSLDPTLTLYGPDGEQLAYDDDSGGDLDSLLTAALPVTGTYTVVVASFGTSSGDYQLSRY